MAFPTPPAILGSRNLRIDELDHSPTDALVRIYAWMHLMRVSDNRILELFRQGLIRGTVTGGQGNEGLIIPLALLADKGNDVASFTHRDSGAHLIWGSNLVEHLNQYFANAGSPTKAREGNIHHGDVPNRSIPMISHLGAMLSVVAGATDSQRRQGRPAVGFAFFGDGASSTGDVHETMNLASLLSLPVIFVIENNCYAYSTPTCEQFATGTELWKRAAGYGIDSFALDCTRDVSDVVRKLGAAIDKVRTTSRPMLIEANTLRLRGHAAYDTGDYLLPGESDGFFSRDPVPRFRAQVVEAVGLSRVAALEAELNEYLEACIKVAIATARPSPDGMEADLFAPPGAPLAWKPEPAAPAQLNIAQALNLGLRKILGERPESLILGQDIGA
ncbi:MAG: thiamine pyrophosphate-dependent dehydrogenase E1 component subunit alpha, partial [Opitutaceae bacterium]